ncbi:winged helix-turn-helix transcriptional regulator [Microbispora sp. ATCC PTA-5024]|uniref:winged helix-turn-helix transcriptional regulator n=1 Tax=Microbispora sp. ATCC PTA-5024 TaxID=316330 RepID=UPI0003DD25E6|nr:helix-turn-helix domain-containing protein [Microbispora sp. ATCC PTA-5024]ETK32702.1 ArsR family transcriptional regulator [Microbispora sp. ATCC PTA-5024]
MALGKDYEGQDCSLARALELVGERWTLLVIRDAFYGVRRYSDFVAHLDIPRAVLADRLAALTAAGVLERRRYQQSPPRDEYVLTQMGRDLWPAVHALSRWGGRYLSPDGPSKLYTHALCGSPLDQAGTCPECGGPVPPEDVEARPVRPTACDRRDDPVTRLLEGPRRLLRPLTEPV